MFIEFLRQLGFREQVRQHLPIRLESPNAIELAQTLTAFLISVLAGGRRFAHAARLRGDRALQAVVGICPRPGKISNTVTLCSTAC